MAGATGDEDPSGTSEGTAEPVDALSTRGGNADQEQCEEREERDPS